MGKGHLIVSKNAPTDWTTRVCDGVLGRPAPARVLVLNLLCRERLPRRANMAVKQIDRMQCADCGSDNEVPAGPTTVTEDLVWVCKSCGAELVPQARTESTRYRPTRSY
jgi:ribosomal protein L37AE/L43A